MVLENKCYLCEAWLREDQISVTRIPIWATATDTDPERWKDTDAAMAFVNDQGEVVTFCADCALNATKRCWERIQERCGRTKLSVEPVCQSIGEGPLNSDE